MRGCSDAGEGKREGPTQLRRSESTHNKIGCDWFSLVRHSALARECPGFQLNLSLAAELPNQQQKQPASPVCQP